MRKNMRKILLILILSILVTSCSSDDSNEVSFEFIPAEGAIIPTEMGTHMDYEIQVMYTLPSQCHGFSDFYYEATGNTRTIAVLALESQNGTTCSSPGEEEIASFIFRPLTAGQYTFRFWNGKDEEGQDIYIEYIVPVSNTPGN